jgi:anti-sigma factor RsiW
VSKAQADGASARAQLQPEDLIDRLIDYHSAPPKPLVTDAELVPELERDVGVRIAAPSLAKFGAHLQGGTVVRVRGDQPAAVLRYRTADNHIFSVYFYNPTRLPLHAGLVPRMFHEEPLYEGYRRGYTIVAELRRGVGYAITTDLDEPLSAELVRAISNSAVTQ